VCVCVCVCVCGVLVFVQVSLQKMLSSCTLCLSIKLAHLSPTSMSSDSEVSGKGITVVIRIADQSDGYPIFHL